MNKPFVFVLFFVLLFAVSASAQQKVVFKGPVGSYTPQPGEIVVEQLDGNLQVSRPDGNMVTIHIATLPSGGVPAQPQRYQGPRLYSSPDQTGDQFVYRNEHTPGDGSVIYYDPKEIVILRKQDMDEFEVINKAEIARRRQDQSEDKDKFRRRTGWVEVVQDYQSDRYKQSNKKAQLAERARKEQVRERERAMKNFSKALEKAQDDAERQRKELARALEKAQKEREKKRERRERARREK